MLASACLLALVGASRAAAAGNPCGPPVTSVIACENSQPGDPPSDWQITGDGDTSIRGFATSMSVNKGQTISFKISTPATSYHIDVLRLGYYQGNGARKIAANLRPTATLPQNQPACLTASTTGLIDCGNWAGSASWTVPSTAVSGLYIAHLVRDDTGGSSQIPFVVRDDSSHSDIVYQTSDTTWQAYNTYGGNSLYQCTVACPPGNPLGYKAAYKVSYNRPFTFTADQGRASPYYAEYPMIRFLEANGYDVSYVSGQDVDRAGSLLLNHKIFISSGHDEYWSGGQRANVEAARDAGVNLAFFSGNEIFWKTRWEPSTDGSSTPYRTLVTYKETHFDAPTDPQDPPTWTGAWRDPRFSPPGDARAENALSGQFFIVNSGTSDIQVPYAYSRLRLWRNTSVASLSPGQTATLGAGIGTLGYEWDEDPDNGYRPTGEFDLSSTTKSGVEVFTDYGSTTATGTATHHLSLYRAPSGALVFGAGTVQWSWGLDSTNNSGKPPDPTMQQATVNLFADMGVQPNALLAGLVPATGSTDSAPPTSTITSPSAGANLQDGASATITGTASDSGGGVVAGVEVSTDNGATWHPASGTTNWTYTWIVNRAPSTRILSRAVDDSGNLETPSSGIAVNIGCSCSIFGTSVPTTPDSGDKTSIEVGVKFTSDVFGTASGIRFYKAAANTGTHVGSLWTAGGQLLARATFTGESASGWQQVNFSTPVPINPNTTYVASYYAPASHYSASEGYFFPPPSPEPDGNGVVDSPPLHALRTGPAGGNGVYTYTTSPTFPTSTFNAENYWVDVAFTQQPAPGQVTNVNATAGYKSALVSWSAPTTGGPTTTYTVTPYIGGTAQTPTTVTGLPAPTSTTITGLTNGTTYRFTVTASNPSGIGPESAGSPAVTPSSTASVVINGGFESGISGWTPGGLTSPVASTTKVHSGTGSAQLGVLSGPEPNGDSSLSQTLTVPPGTSTLSFWYLPGTADATCSGSSCKYDWQEAQIRNTAGQTLASIFKSNSNSQTWTPVTFDASAYAGQTIVLWFNVHDDGSSPPDDTWMYLDDITLNASGPTPPGQPTNVSATASDGSATVTWTAPSNGGSPITSYKVTPYIGSTAQPATTITGSPPATSATVTGLTNGTAYTFTVTAINSVGPGPESANSAPVTPTAPTPPGQPTNVSATAGNGSATVTWTAPASNGGSPITSYTVTPFIGTTAQTTTTITGSPPATTATVTGLTNGTAYTFTVTATNSVGTGLASSPSSAVTPAAAPTAPTAPTATAGNAQATVSWTAPSDGGSAITSYTITPYIGTTAQTTTTITGSPPATTATVTGLTNGTAYTFTVTATNAIGTGPPSLASNSVTPAAPPGTPTNATAAAGNAQATVSWTAPSNGGSQITSYTITPYIGTTAQTTTTITGSPPATTATVTGLTNGTTYTFTVTATNSPGTSPPSTASNAITPTAPTAPGAPSNVSATAGNAQATVSWTAPSNGGSPITSYTVTPYIGTSAQTPMTITGSPPATSATITGLTNAATYTFTVTATNSVGTGPPSSASNAVTPAAPTVPGSPGNVSATAGNAQATVSWSAPSNGGSQITSYTITPYIGTTAQTTTTITGSPPATTATVTGLTNGTAYTFTVTATNSVGTGLASSPSSAVTPAAAPTAPTAPTATAGNAQATVSWTAPSDGGSAITSYTITPYIGTTAQTTTTITGSPPATTATVTGLTNGTAYTFTVTATNAIGTGPPSLASNSVTPAAPPGTPTNATAAAGNAQATVSWTAPSNGGSQITSYTITPYIGTTAQTTTTITGSPPATTATVTGLTNGTTYTFTVTATNSPGTSPPSTASNAITPTATVTPAFIQQVASHIGGATSLAVTPASNISAGNRLVVVVGVWNNTAATAKSVADSAGNTYTEVLHFKASENTEMSVWTAPVTVGGGTKPKVTVTSTAKADLGLGVLEYSGLSTATGATAIDQTAQNTGTTGAAGTVSSGATAATSASNELALGFYIDSGFGDTLTAGSGFTSRSNVSKTSDMELLVEDQLPAQGATPNASAGTGANTTWLMSTVVFKHG